MHACVNKNDVYMFCVYMLNYRLSQKFKLLGNSEFNHLTISLPLPLTCGPKLPLNKWGSNKWGFNILNGRQSKTRDRTQDLLL